MEDSSRLSVGKKKTKGRSYNGSINSTNGSKVIVVKNIDSWTHCLFYRSRPPHFNKNHWRGDLCRFLHSPYLHHFMNLLLLVDIGLLALSMQLELYYLESKIADFELACSEHAHSLSHYGNDYYEHVEHDVVIASATILSLFGLEWVLSLIAEGSHFLENPLHIIDCIVIALSLFFETTNQEFVASVVMLIRAWRFLRLIHGVVELTEDSDDEDCDKEADEDGKKEAKDVLSIFSRKDNHDPAALPTSEVEI